MQKQKILRKGYTTGVHTSFAFRSALDIFSSTNNLTITKTNKIDNDDLDVTKGCEIVVSLSYDINELVINTISHTPYIFTQNKNILKIYAGQGVGIVTKDGLKAPKNYPAINPIPLEALENIFKNTTLKSIDKTIFCTVSISNGETIAKQTANSKVGVLGGLSILGTSGWVKPISATAYINSIKEELNFIKANHYDNVVLTLGNSSLQYAKKNYNYEQIVEIGNFIYDSIELSNTLGMKNITLICGIGKLTKIAQGFKNTHNRFGSIDFKKLQILIHKNLNIKVDIEQTKTVKGISIQLKKLDLEKDFINLMKNIAYIQLNQWFKNINIKIEIPEMGL
jgi:cobalt-precorrin-5B (C1)-methyltransferase